MQSVDVVSFFTQALYLVLWLSLPPIIVGSVVGTLFSLFQALTQAFVEVIHLDDLQLPCRTTAFAPQRGECNQDHDDSDHQGHGFGQKTGVLG